MEFIRTPTPPYGGQQPNGNQERRPGLLEWFASLLRTPTPRYQTAPARYAERQSPEPEADPKAEGTENAEESAQL